MHCMSWPQRTRNSQPTAGDALARAIQTLRQDWRPVDAPGSAEADLERAMQGHTLAQAELVGVYQR